MTDTLFPFLAEAVTPWHAVTALARRLGESGFVELRETDPWRLKPGQRYLVRRGGSALAAFVAGQDPTTGFRIAAAHTDSPGWRLKLAQQKPHASGLVRVGTEVYGGPIHATWFDRPLAVAGRVVLRSGAATRELLVRTAPVAVFPNLAIHFNREVNKGLTYDLGEHLTLLAALGSDPDLQGYLARTAGFDRKDWLAGDLFAVEPAAPTLLGDSLFVSPRIDNLTGCDAVVHGLLKAGAGPATLMALLYDQEEIGSRTWTGADSSLLADLLSRITLGLGGTADDGYRARAASFLLSVDSAHGVHPNWAAQHDGEYAPQLGQGPVLKSSARFSYATTAASEAVVRLAADAARVPLQSFVMKSTLVPGSTVGPISTASAGLPGADVGIPIWAMHSSNETADLRDQEGMVALVAAVLSAPTT